MLELVVPFPWGEMIKDALRIRFRDSSKALLVLPGLKGMQDIPNRLRVEKAGPPLEASHRIAAAKRG